MSGSRQEGVPARRPLVCCTLSGMLIVLRLLAVQTVFGHDPGRGPPSDTGPPQASFETPPLSPGDSRRLPPLVQGDGWHHNLVRDRQVEFRLRNAALEFAAGKFPSALTQLQSVLDREEDVFVRLDSEPVPCGAHLLATRLLSNAPAEALAIYETISGREARRLLDAAVATGRIDRQIAVVRRFFHTAAGFEAADRLATHWLDHFAPEMALALWQRLLDEPTHRARVQPLLRAKIACCREQLGQSSLARSVVKKVAGQMIRIGGRSIQTDAWLDQFPTTLPPQLSSAGFALVGGGTDRNGVSSGTPPALGRRLWTASLASEQSQHISTLAAAWETWQVQNGLPIGVSQFPVIAGNQIVFRDYEGLRTVDLQTGTTKWFYPCVSRLSQEITPKHAAPVEGNPDPNNKMQLIVGHCTLGMLASDGRYVFAVDRIETNDLIQTASVTPATDNSAGGLRQCNTLLALDLSPRQDSPAGPVWSAGGRPNLEAPESSLAGHYFLGPPLPIGDRLFTVSEWNQQLHVSCLRSQTGTVIWTQVLCSVPQPIGSDHQRFALVCLPAFAEGVLVCPTQAGVLVGIDSLRGTLLWAASYDDGEPQQRQQMSAWPYSTRRRYAHPGYASLPVVHAGSVVYLPAHSDTIQCVDLHSGHLQWLTRRDDLEPTTATEYVAAIDGPTVIVVGRRKCRGLSLENGDTRWTVRLAASPAGRGVRLGNSYLVPLDDGRIVSLDIGTGQTVGVSRGNPELRPGNLVAAGEFVISMGPSEIAAWPQAGTILTRFLNETAGTSPADDRAWELAELQLALGRYDAARETLWQALRLSEGESRQRILNLFRDQMLTPSASHAAADADWLGRFAAVSDVPEDHAQFLIENTRRALHAEDAAGLIAATRELLVTSPATSVRLAHDPARRVALEIAMSQLFESKPGSTPASAKEQQRTLIESEFARAIGDRDVATLCRLVRWNRESAPAAAARVELGRLLMELGYDQRAELELLAARADNRAPIAGAATRLLAELWDRRQLPHSAALLLEELETTYAEQRVTGQQTGRHYLATFARDRPVWQAYERLAAPHWPTIPPRITERRVAHEMLQNTYNGNGILNLSTPRSSPFDLFDKGRGIAGMFSVVDRFTGAEHPETIHVPGRCFYLANPQPGYLQHAFVGNFFPVGGTGAVHGISLLERKLLWSTVIPELAGTRELVRVGPAGKDFCSFQVRQHLFVVDPADGRLLWHRDDLEALSGLMTGEILGIIGDEEVLVVFGSNGANYTLYDTGTGAELRKGKLDIQPRLPRRAFGRRLFHHTASLESKRLRVWDALTDRFVWDCPSDAIADASLLEGVPPGTKVLTFVRETDEAAFVTRTGRIQLVRMTDGQPLFDLAATPAQLENLSFLRAFRDRDRYYFNLQRSWPPGKAPPITGYIVNDGSLSTVHVQGDLCAVDRETHELLWQRTLGNRSILQLSEFRLPVLVTLYRVRKGDQTNLCVEILDIKTGATIAGRDDLFSDKLLQLGYERQPARIDLRGAKTEIRLEFPTSVASVPPR